MKLWSLWFCALTVVFTLLHSDGVEIMSLLQPRRQILARRGIAHIPGQIKQSKRWESAGAAARHTHLIPQSRTVSVHCATDHDPTNSLTWLCTGSGPPIGVAVAELDAADDAEAVV